MMVTMPRKTLTIIGFLLIVVQISGVPHSWKTALIIFSGIYLIIVALRGAKDNYDEVSESVSRSASVLRDDGSNGNTESYDAKETDEKS